MNDSNFRPLSTTGLSSETLKQFITRLRRREGWDTSKGKENEVIFMLAFVASLVGGLVFGACGIIGYWPIYFVVVWTAAVLAYVGVRREGDGETVKEMDHAIDVINKAMKRGKVGIERRAGSYHAGKGKFNDHIFALTGVYHNDLTDQDVTDSLLLDEKELTELYDLLDSIGNFRSNDTTAELPISTLEIPINLQ